MSNEGKAGGGFGFVEVLIVVAVVGIIAFLIMAGVHGSREADKAQAVHIGSGIYKMCDAGNAIYFGGGGLVVVPGGCTR